MSPDAALRTSGLAKKFGEFAVLRGVDLTVAKGATHAIIGPNGAGKTTLVNVITGLYRSSGGSVFLAGEDITRAHAYHIARQGLARTFQITSLFLDLTLRENIEVALVARRKYRLPRLGPDGAAFRGVDDIIELVGLGELMDQKVESLSHGDQRLLEVAVALAAEPSVLLLDEPTAGMSPAETEGFITLVNSRLKARHTIVLIEHDMDVVMQTADRISVLESGKVLADGTPAEIMNDARVQEAYLGRA